MKIIRRTDPVIIMKSTTLLMADTMDEYRSSNKGYRDRQLLYDSSPNKHGEQVFEVNLIQKPVPCDFKLLLIPTCFPASQLDYRKFPSFSCTFLQKVKCQPNMQRYK